MASIFISYRREDTGGHAGRLFDRLTTRFGDDPIFMDVQDIHPGQNFAKSIDETIARCDCVLVVIGPRWLAAVQQRAEAEEDFVRYEISAALKRDIAVIPVLVGGARMPPPGQLPADLRALSHRHAMEIRDERFEDDVARLAESVRDSARIAEGRGWLRRHVNARPYLVAIPVLLVAGVLAIFVATRPPPLDVNGVWIAEMQKPGQRPYRVRFHFDGDGETVSGMVEYPTGDGPVHTGQLSGSRLTFQTSHVPQFASSAATIRYEGQVTADEIRLVSTDEAGMATGTARRVPAP